MNRRSPRVFMYNWASLNVDTVRSMHGTNLGSQSITSLVSTTALRQQECCDPDWAESESQAFFEGPTNDFNLRRIMDVPYRQLCV